ncbi:hypothetical protein IQ06DRAFT_346719 [Phaeosphaeriaceae sp. SRC1lsM3a]|nr:hypothetical protein IQ06DRAFT_346719 [Stagonospora sp. SRC1lsM3a]
MGAIKMFTPWDLRPTIEITAFTLTSLSTLVVAIRFYCRIWIVGRLKFYDYLTVAAVLSTWALCACNHYQLQFGSGAQGGSKASANLSKEQLQEHMRHELVGSAVSWYLYHIGYLFTLAMVKLSILVFYLSFATRRVFRILVNICIGITVASSIAMILVVALQCPKKPQFALTPGILVNRRRVHCFDLRVVFYWQSGYNIASDLVILLLPMPLLFGIQGMHRAKRLSLILVFSVGLLIPIASGIRFWGLYLWATSGLLARYYGGYIIFWSQVELNTAIICSSAPSLQPLLKRAFHRLSSSRDAYYYYGGGQNLPSPIPWPETTRLGHQRCDSISGLQHPPSVYDPKVRAETTVQSKPVVNDLTEEEKMIRARVRAFSSPSSSIYSMPISPAHPAFSTP